MGKPKDLEALERYRKVLLVLGHVSGYIQWKRLPHAWLSAEIPNVGIRLVHELMQKHVTSGGKIDQVEETRPEFVSWRYHYDLRMPISQRLVYVETVFQDDGGAIEDCTIWVVNIHDK